MNASMHPQYARHGQLPQRSPHTAPRPKGIQPILSGVQGPHSSQHGQYAAQRNAAQYMDNDPASRKAHAPTDRNMPDGIEDLIIGDGVQQYKTLREVERKLDVIMMRKRLDMQDSMQYQSKRYRTLRIWVSNTVDNQPWQGHSLDENTFDFNTGEEATYKVKIEGRLLDEDDGDDTSEKDSDEVEDGNTATQENDGDATEQDQGTATSKPSTPSDRTKFSHFFKAITIDFDRGKSINAETPTAIEWKKPAIPPNSANLPAAADFDCLEFERKSDENINCTINLYRDEEPERFLLSPELADLLDTKEDDRASILYKLWEYVKAMNLQQDDEKRRFNCDDRLRHVFKNETLSFPELRTLILHHTFPLPPLSLPYTIRVDPDFHTTSPSPSTIYDILIPLPPSRPAYLTPSNPLSGPSTTATVQQIRALDAQLAELVQAINKSKSKHAFMESMSKEPAVFLKRWMGSQRRDMEVILGERWGVDEAGLQGREWRKGGVGGVWGSEHVRESVGLMVGKEGRGRL